MNRKIPKSIAPILKEVKSKLAHVYGERLTGIILYGSYAKGVATENSDIDLIILLKDMKNPGDEIIKSSYALGDLELTHDTLISILPLQEGVFHDRDLPVILNARRDGIMI